MEVRVSKWGNSLAIRLPAKLAAALGLKEGDRIDVRPAGHEEPPVVEIERKLTVDELFERVRNMPNKLPADYKFDRRDAVRPGYEDRD